MCPYFPIKRNFKMFVVIREFTALLTWSCQGPGCANPGFLSRLWNCAYLLVCGACVPHFQVCVYRCLRVGVGVCVFRRTSLQASSGLVGVTRWPAGHTWGGWSCTPAADQDRQGSYLAVWLRSHRCWIVAWEFPSVFQIVIQRVWAGYIKSV